MSEILIYDNLKLIPLSTKHYTELAALAQEPSIWHLNPTLNDPKDFKSKWFDKAIKQIADKERIVYVIEFMEQLVGSSSFYDLENQPLHLSIGYTWLHPNFQGNGINSICKYLLLQHAFEYFKVKAVYFSIDKDNSRSRQAVKNLGATEVEVIKDHLQRPDGSMRDTVKYAINQHNWPTIKHNLELRIKAKK